MRMENGGMLFGRNLMAVQRGVCVGGIRVAESQRQMIFALFISGTDVVFAFWRASVPLAFFAAGRASAQRDGKDKGRLVFFCERQSAQSFFDDNFQRKRLLSEYSAYIITDGCAVCNGRRLFILTGVGLSKTDLRIIMRIYSKFNKGRR